METPLLFPFAQYWWFYAAFTAFIVGLLALDLGVFHRKAHTVTVKESLIWSVVWISLGLAFGAGLWQYALWRLPQVPELAMLPGFDPIAAANQVGLEYLAGYVIEKALAVDNIFVIAMVFAYFNIPSAYQHRVLFYGILGALFFRAVFISLGAVLLQFHWVIIAAGIFLIFTGVKMLFAGESKLDPERNPLLKLLRRFIPVTNEFHGQSFFVRQGGRWWATPVFVCLFFIEISDIIFAIDSVPAIFALTREPLIVFTSNIFAILGLRAMYFLLAGIMDRFRYLKVGLALILVFVGLKMVWLNDLFGGKFPIVLSLGIIGAILVLSMVASLLASRKPEASVP
ncbi:MAG: inner membrane protein alx [Fibrobacterota bacterium]|jgi:tellurite resistance protein TerC